MFRAKLRISRQPASHTPNNSAQTDMRAARTATKTPCKCRGCPTPKTSSNVILPHELLSKQFCPQNIRKDAKGRSYISRPFAYFAGKQNYRLAIFATISLNSASGLSSFPRRMLRRALMTQSYFVSTVSNSTRLSLKLSRSNRFARLRSWALPIAFLVAVMPTRCRSKPTGKMKTVIQRPSKRTPCS